jgi:L-aminopeptidase/D-esterase-like protein
VEPLPPPLPAPGRALTIPGFTLGHGTDPVGKTGVTVILCPDGALAAAEVRGSATGTRQFDSLVLGHHVASRAHAVVLAGGSGFGLAAAEPVVEWLRRRGRGFDTGVAIVPLVPTAILFDLGFGDAAARPGSGLVESALATATGGEVATGSVGAGTGATVGKARGLACAMKGGFGFASLSSPGGPTVAAAVAVNAFGDVRDPFDPAAAPGPGGLLAACRESPGSPRLVGAEATLAALPAETPHPWEGNTTLAVVMTDAVVAKPAALKVCQMAFGGLYRTLAPALSLYDGDLVVTLSLGQVRAHVNQLGVLAEQAVAHAILTAVRSADGFGILPAVRDLAG